jgi:hypothetical protein
MILNSEDILILTILVEQRWNGRNKSRYIELGYKFTKIGDAFQVSIEHLSHGSRAKVLVACPDCGEQREMAYSNILKHNSTRCRKCANFKATFNDLSSKRFGRLIVIECGELKNSQYTWKCLCDCGRELYVRSADLTRGKSTSCGCKRDEYVASLQYRVGKRHPNWKDISEAERRKRRDHKSSLLREKCFKRDDYTCLSCSRRGGDLEAHHLYDWASYPDMRYTLENIVTLCVVCHRNFHTWTETCNPEMFLGWKNIERGS